jgi:hypothetical protein
MSSFPKPNILTFRAGEDLSAKQYTFVKLTAEETVASQTTKGGKSIGILMNAPIAGDFAEVAMPGGGAKLKTGANTDLMGTLIPNTSGQGIPSDAATQWVGAQGLAAATSGDIIPVNVIGFESQA